MSKQLAVVFLRNAKEHAIYLEWIVVSMVMINMKAMKAIFG